MLRLLLLREGQHFLAHLLVAPRVTLEPLAANTHHCWRRVTHVLGARLDEAHLQLERHLGALLAVHLAAQGEAATTTTRV